MIDLGRLDPDDIIDLPALCNSGLFRLSQDMGALHDFGVNLTDEVR